MSSPLSKSGLIAGDIQIGAVELKNSTTDDRMSVLMFPDLSGNTYGGSVSLPRAIYESAAVVLTNGQYSPLRMNSSGYLLVSIAGQSGGSLLTDSTPNPTTVSNGALGLSFNGSMWDRNRSGQITPTSAMVGYQNVIPATVYKATPTTRTDGQGGPTLSDAVGNALTSLNTYISGEDSTNNLLVVREKPDASGTYCPSRDISAALEASSITKASAGVLYGGTIRVDSTAPSATYYIQVMNSATLPANGAVTLIAAPVKVVHVSGTDDLVQLDYGEYGIYGSAGIVVDISTTEFTKTISGAYLSTDLNFA